MTPPIVVLVHLTIPRRLADQFGTQSALKAYLEAQGIWPQRGMVDKWRLHPETAGYLVEVEVALPSLAVAQRE
jgi:hypothetical protein